MCRETPDPGAVAAAAPRPAAGAAVDPIALRALVEPAPDVVVPAHCTGWRAQMRLGADLPEAFTPGAAGRRYRFS